MLGGEYAAITRSDIIDIGMRQEEYVQRGGLWRSFQRKPLLFWSAVGALSLLLIVILLQLFWPSNRLWPMQKIDGVSVSMMTTDEASETLREIYENQTIRLVNNDEVEIITITLKDAGLSVDTVEQMKDANEYPLWQKFIPFSSLFRLWRASPSRPLVKIDDGKKLLSFSSGTARDATITVENGRLKVNPSAVSYHFETEQLKSQLQNIRPNATKPITIKMDIAIEQPDVITPMAQTLANRVSSHIKNGQTFKFESRTFKANTTDVANWLTFYKEEDSKQLNVAISRESFGKFVDGQIAPAINIASKPTVVSTHNGAETSRENGHDGRAVNVNKLVDDLNAIIQNGGGDITIETTKVASTITYKRSYSADLTGLRAELNNKYAGKAYAISVVDLSGGGRNLAINDTRVFTAASTYKLYVAYSMLKAIESGEVTWNTPLNGTTLSVCFDRMIINSDNPCPKAWLDWKTYARVTQEAHSIGANSTCFGCGNGMTTTTRDLSIFLTKLHNGSILTSSSQTRLLDTMKRQLYRQGIPKGIGSNGVVADKVGFLNGLLHDAAIVYSNKGDYVMVIMTNGYSWASIADTANTIHAKM